MSLRAFDEIWHDPDATIKGLAEEGIGVSGGPGYDAVTLPLGRADRCIDPTVLGPSLRVSWAPNGYPRHHCAFLLPEHLDAILIDIEEICKVILAVE